MLGLTKPTQTATERKILNISCGKMSVQHGGLHGRGPASSVDSNGSF